jgi:uncharacterized protein
MPDNDRIITAGFEIKLNGSDLKEDVLWRVEAVSVEDEINMPAMFRITISTTDFASVAWKDIDLETFKIGDEIKISMGVDKIMAMMIGEITTIEPQFGDSCIMELRGYDRMHRLRFGAFRRSFVEMTDSDIVSSVVQDAGLTAKADSTSTTHLYVFQNNINNYEFLLSRAKANGFEMFVDDKTFLFRESKESSSPDITLEYGLDIERFSARMTALTEGSEVEVRGWDMQKKEEITGSAKSGSEASLMKGSDSGFSLSENAFSASKISLIDNAVVDASHAEAIAKAVYNQKLKEFIFAEGKVTGHPAIRAGKTVEIKGVGPKFSGVYYIVASTHSIGSRDSFTTTFRMRRTAI